MRHGQPLNSTRRRLRKEQLARRHGQCCAYCRWPFASLREATLDHIAPLSLWRTWSVTSLLLACVDCNRRKADRLPLSLALLLLAWTDPTRPVVRPVDVPLLARLALAHHKALTSVTARVTSGVTPRPAPAWSAAPTGERSTGTLHESTAHRPDRRSAVRSDCLRAPRPVRVCAGPTGEAVPA
ncbi:HNH endonuclease [Streptomyces xinghaiensis]|uniref:HNH endonuclease n=2 Tax=Streptomyces TaxID=1883 RepID=A0A420V3L8_9ACTN|nr:MULTISPECIES: HNH endonuclease [Streptomyces]KNE83172.1 HNH endonuclease [Streptomyces fradiae]OFA54375.1 HNH endonuclease [Streptomyces fradiae]PQM20880.1 HNH endonuclease [Streptomyces xinghaiensis]RKM95804.1 HNH endonuclease [Streptomyces xinghaiensis]RNC70784.1 HNH endonuclease [Streptomyces xinghaiensis]